MLLARHVIDVHRRGGDKADKGKDPKNYKEDNFDARFIRAYVQEAKSFQPLIPNSLEQKIVLRYVEMRQKEREESSDERKDYVTPRQLLGMIRLSQALVGRCFCYSFVGRSGGD